MVGWGDLCDRVVKSRTQSSNKDTCDILTLVCEKMSDTERRQETIEKENEDLRKAVDNLQRELKEVSKAFATWFAL